MSTPTKPQAHILRVIVKRIFRICPRYYGWCLLFALLMSLETLSRILLPTLLLDEMTHAIRFDRIVIWGSLCVCIPMLLSAVNTFIATALDDCARYIEDELELSIDQANMQVRYMEFDAPDIHAVLQEIKDGQNMVGPITGIIRNHVLSIMQHVISLLLYIPILWRLIATDALSIAAGYPWAWICGSTPLFLLLIMALCGITIALRYSLQRKGLSLVERFSGVERAYQYYVGIRSDYENGADIRLNGLGAMLQRRMNDYYQQERQMHLSVNGFQGKAGFILSVFKGIQTFAIYGFIIGKTLLGAIDIGGFYLYTNALTQGLGALSEVIRAYGEIRIAAKYYKGYPKLWDREHYTNHADKKPMQASPKQCGEIVFDNVSFSYPGSEKQVLRNICLTIRPGEKIAIVGRNGMGKSTLIKVLLGLYPVDSGHIFIDGKDINTLDGQELFAMFSTVFQDYRLFAASIADNVAAFEENPDATRVRCALVKAGFHAESDIDLTKQVSRHLSEEGILFSGGEEQKIAIARALYKNAPYYIMDEPSAALDPIAEREMNEHVLNEADGHTLIIVSHRLTACTMANRVIVLEDGRIYEEGSHQELLKRQGLYAQMWEAQAKNYR